jgi:hypothetical protein
MKSANKVDSEAVKSDGASRRVQQIVSAVFYNTEN